MAWRRWRGAGLWAALCLAVAVVACSGVSDLGEPGQKLIGEGEELVGDPAATDELLGLWYSQAPDGTHNAWRFHPDEGFHPLLTGVEHAYDLYRWEAGQHPEVVERGEYVVTTDGFLVVQAVADTYDGTLGFGLYGYDIGSMGADELVLQSSVTDSGWRTWTRAETCPATPDAGGWVTSPRALEIRAGEKPQPLARFVDMALGPAGEPQLAWGSGGQRDLLVAERPARCAFEMAAVDVPIGAPSLAVDASGTRHLLYVTYLDATLSYAHDTSGSWEYVDLAPIVGYDVAEQAATAAASGGGAHLAWCIRDVNATTSELYYARATDGEVGEPELVEALPWLCPELVLREDPGGEPVIFKGAERNRRDASGAWTLEELPLDDGDVSVFDGTYGGISSAAYDQEGRLHLVGIAPDPEDPTRMATSYWVEDGGVWTGEWVGPGRGASIDHLPDGTPVIGVVVPGDGVYLLTGAGSERAVARVFDDRSSVIGVGNYPAITQRARVEVDAAGGVHIAAFDLYGYREAGADPTISPESVADAGGGAFEPEPEPEVVPTETLWGVGHERTLLNVVGAPDGRAFFTFRGTNKDVEVEVAAPGEAPAPAFVIQSLDSTRALVHTGAQLVAYTNDGPPLSIHRLQAWDDAGAPLWSVQPTEGLALDLGLDVDGHVVTVGGAGDHLVAAGYDATGAAAWTWTTPSEGGGQQLKAADMGPEGFAYVATRGGAMDLGGGVSVDAGEGFQPTYLARIGADRIARWAIDFDEEIIDLALLPGDGVGVLAAPADTGNKPETYPVATLSAFDGSGALAWSLTLGSDDPLQAGLHRFSALQVLASGELAVIGREHLDLTGQDFSGVIGVSAAGQRTWTVPMSGDALARIGVERTPGTLIVAGDGAGVGGSPIVVDAFEVPQDPYYVTWMAEVAP